MHTRFTWRPAMAALTLAITLGSVGTALAGDRGTPGSTPAPNGVLPQPGPCQEIVDAIKWGSLGGSKWHPVSGYFTLHNGVKSNVPIVSTQRDQVWFATGTMFVYGESGPAPYLSGTLAVHTNQADGSMEPSSAQVRVDVYAGGKIRFQRLLDGKPLGAITQVNATCVDGDLLTAVDAAGEVITVGVARKPAETIVPN